MAIKIAVINNKGGAGKTTTAGFLLDGMSRLKNNNGRYMRVLLWDFDTQQNSSLLYDERKGVSKTAYDILMMSPVKLSNGRLEPKEDFLKRLELATKDAIIKTKNGHLIQSSPELEKFSKKVDGMGKEYKLLRAVMQIESMYDFIIYDTPPRMGLIVQNVLTASDYCIIPTEPTAFCYQGINQVMPLYDEVRNNTNENLKLLGILMIKYDKRTTMSQDMIPLLEELAEKMDSVLFKTKIRINQAVINAQSQLMTLLDYDPKSYASQDYLNFLTEMLERIDEVDGLENLLGD